MYQCEYNRFDIVAAHYCYCVNWHSGQWSKEYARLSKISGYSHNMPTTLEELANFSENAVQIYLNLVEKNEGGNAESAEWEELQTYTLESRLESQT